jgi:hypothetical protein
LHVDTKFRKRLIKEKEGKRLKERKRILGMKI